MSVALRCNDDILVIPMQEDLDVLRKSSIGSFYTQAEEEDVADLSIPFSSTSVRYVLNQGHVVVQDLSFDEALEVRRCRDYLGLNRDDVVDNRLFAVSMEITRAAGVNLCHFQEASLFMNVLSKTCDDRIVPMSPRGLEGCYWQCVHAKLNLEPIVRAFIGDATYDDLVAKARHCIYSFKVVD